MNRQTRVKWQHQRGDVYAVILGSAVGNPDAGYRIEHVMPGGFQFDLASAIKDGFTYNRSDDFNIGVFREGKLSALLWMHEVVDDDPAEMRRMAHEIGWQDH